MTGCVIFEGLEGNFLYCLDRDFDGGDVSDGRGAI